MDTDFVSQITKDKEYLVIDIGPKENPIIPLDGESKLQVLTFESDLSYASAINKSSPNMHVVSANLDDRFHVGMNKSKRKKFGANEESFSVVTLSLTSVVEKIPTWLEVFVRSDENNLSIGAVKNNENFFQRVSLFKKRVALNSLNQLEEVSDEWTQTMSAFGFELIKLDKNMRGFIEFVWLNKLIKLPDGRESVLSVLPKDKRTNIRNFIKLSFSTLFLKNNNVMVYDGVGDFNCLDNSDVLWKLCVDKDSLPQDAFPIHEDKAKKNTASDASTNSAEAKECNKLYLAHSFFKGGIHCGHVSKENPKEALFCWGKYQLSTGDFQILCGSGFSWVSVKDAKIPKGAVVGGREEIGDELFATRVNVGGKVFIGKVCANWLINEGNKSKLKCQYYDGMSKFTSDFDVLVWGKPCE